MKGNTMFNIVKPPIYEQDAVQWMRDELLYTGFKELLSPKDVDEYLTDPSKGTVLVVINSVCGCAAGSARPGVNLALQNDIIPDHLTTVFAGQERDAVDRVRELITNFPPSSPSFALFMKGKLVHFTPRYEIEGNGPEKIAEDLIDAFNKYCTRRGPSISKEDYAKLEHAKMCGSEIPKIQQN